MYKLTVVIGRDGGVCLRVIDGDGLNDILSILNVASLQQLLHPLGSHFHLEVDFISELLHDIHLYGAIEQNLSISF